VRRCPDLGGIYCDSEPRVALDGVAHYLERACNSGLIQAQDVRLAVAQFWVCFVGIYSYAACLA
jgi:hypothetical protein